LDKQKTANNQTMSEQVFQIMRDNILSGIWKPGTSIKIRDTAKLLNTSEMPVREAVKSLVEHGLAVHHAHRGAVVRELSIQELRDFYRVRILLEAEAARLGAENISLKDITAMRKLWGKLQQAIEAGDIIKALKLDSDYLLILYNSCGNQVLVDQIISLWNRVQPYKVLWAQSSLQSGLFSWKNKPKLLEAAEKKDGNKASELIVEALSNAVEFMEKLFDD